jgi:cytochrome c556
MVSMRSLFIVSVGAALIGSAVWSAEILPPVVRARQDDMKAMSAAAKTLNEFFLGRRKYDVSEIRNEAAAISARAGDRLVSHFGDVVAVPGSDAKQEIGTERGKFRKLADELRAYAAQVGAAAKEGEAMPQTMRMRTAELVEGGPFAKRRQQEPDITSYSSEHAFHMMLQTCTACHAEFRQRD